MTGHQLMTATGTAQLPALFTPIPQAAKQTYLHRENLSKPRKPGPKLHKYMTQKNC